MIAVPQIYKKVADFPYFQQRESKTEGHSKVEGRKLNLTLELE